jgi:hypothetical protein
MLNSCVPSGSLYRRYRSSTIALLQADMTETGARTPGPRKIREVKSQPHLREGSLRPGDVSDERRRQATLLEVVLASMASPHGQYFPLPMWGCGRSILVLAMHDVTQYLVSREPPPMRITMCRSAQNCTSTFFLFTTLKGCSDAWPLRSTTPHTALREPHRSIAQNLTKCSNPVRDFYGYGIPHPRL